jgi:hypothetical protein
MKELPNRGWNLGLVVVGVVLILCLVAAQGSLAEGLAGLLAAIVLGICLLSLIVVVAALWPGVTRQARHHLERSPGKALLVGLVNYLFLGAIGLVLLNLGPLAVFGLPLIGGLLLGTFLGLPAVARLTGERLHALRDRPASPWAEIVAGSVALYLAAWMPVVGWFLLLPALCLWSFGAAALAVVSRQSPGVADAAHERVS